MRSGYLTQTTTLPAPTWQVNCSCDPCRHGCDAKHYFCPLFVLGTPIPNFTALYPSRSTLSGPLLLPQDLQRLKWRRSPCEMPSKQP